MKLDVRSRRQFLCTAAAGILSAPGLLRAREPQPNAVRRNISSFKVDSWQEHFDDLEHGAILCDINSRAVQFWSEDESVYKLYPSSVPASEELTRRGYTRVIRKVEGPSWRPTPSMKERNPDWPDYWPPGPDNPLGTHALYLS